MLKKTTMMVMLVMALAALSACSGQEPQIDHNGEVSTGRAGMALTTDILGDTDVAQIHYSVTGVDCASGEPLDPAFITEAIKDLEDMVLPGDNPDLAGAPFDGNSQHLFADSFFWLPQGCYDVVSQPLNADGEPSEDCYAASQDAVPVFDGQTTEILLINQCEGDAYGGLDVISALNHAPQIDDVSYAPSKFTCEESTTICATVSDPDNDPLEIDWQALTPGANIVAVDETLSEDGALTSCATVQVIEPGDYNVSMTVYDLAYDAEGNLVRIEDLLKEQGADVPSNDSIVLPIHSMGPDACVGQCECPEGFELSALGDTCERITVTSANYNGSTLTVCEGSENENFGALGARFPDGSTLPNNFFGDGYSLNNNSRLHAVGIWACGPDGQSTTNPEDEWIGFSECLSIEEGGAYVVGIAADNFIRAKLNGQTILGLYASNASEQNHPYKHWHMVPVTLTSGANVIELEAMNVGGPAAFGAEIYGPFDPADLVDDTSMMALDYQNNIVWSTGDQIGGNFNTGVTSGWSCEDGYALDLCGGEPTCTLYESQACE